MKKENVHSLCLSWNGSLTRTYQFIYCTHYCIVVLQHCTWNYGEPKHLRQHNKEKQQMLKTKFGWLHWKWFPIHLTHILDNIVFLSLQKPRTSLFSDNVSQCIIPQSTSAPYIIRIPSLHSSYKKQKYTSYCSNLLVPKLFREKECQFWELWEWHYYLQIQELQKHRTPPWCEWIVRNFAVLHVNKIILSLSIPHKFIVCSIIIWSAEVRNLVISATLWDKLVTHITSYYIWLHTTLNAKRNYFLGSQTFWEK